MPSPFPGMDPYLEGSFWTSVHTQLSAEIARQLAPKLSPRYVALTTERFVLEVADYLDETPTISTPVPHVNVEIRDAKKVNLVTAIEVLSPTNKRGLGRKEYLARRRHHLLSSANLMEIDLLRHGERLPMSPPLPTAHYYVILSRAKIRPSGEVWPITLQQPLPYLPIPLLPPDADVVLDLQLALTTIYDLLHYDLAVDYSQPPEVSLEGSDAAWADQLLRSRRLRPS